MNKFMRSNVLCNPGLSDQPVISMTRVIAGAVPCHEINVNHITMSGDELLNSLALLQKGSAKASIEVHCTTCSRAISRDANNVVYASGLDLPFCTKKCSNAFFGV